MPPMAQRDFVAEGHPLYTSDDQVAELLAPAGLKAEHQSVISAAESPIGRLLIASRR
jgi:hypothetical protein